MSRAIDVVVWVLLGLVCLMCCLVGYAVAQTIVRVETTAGVVECSAPVVEYDLSQRTIRADCVSLLSDGFEGD
jgi:hypothetical protein